MAKGKSSEWIQRVGLVVGILGFIYGLIAQDVFAFGASLMALVIIALAVAVTER
jgi:hypothetical protein